MKSGYTTNINYGKSRYSLANETSNVTILPNANSSVSCRSWDFPKQAVAIGYTDIFKFIGSKYKQEKTGNDKDRINFIKTINLAKMRLPISISIW